MRYSRLTLSNSASSDIFDTENEHRNDYVNNDSGENGSFDSNCKHSQIYQLLQTGMRE